MRNGPRKPLNDDDRRLWEAVVADVHPLTGHRPAKRKVPPTLETGHASSKPGSSTPLSHRAPDQRVSAPSPQPLSLDRRTRQKLLRGQVEIDGRLDLHGHSVASAEVELERFLTRAYHAGHRVVLVVTGKGGSDYVRHTLHSATHWHAPERQGRLRQMLPEWLETTRLRSLVSGYQPAHPRHGGGGAWYVRLKKSDRFVRE